MGYQILQRIVNDQMKLRRIYKERKKVLTNKWGAKSFDRFTQIT